MQPHIRDVIQATRDLIDRADVQPRTEAQIGCTILAVSQLTDLCERLYSRILDLERVQNERASE